MKEIILKNRKTGEIVYQKELAKIEKIETNYKNIIISYPNGLKEYYKKAFINLIIDMK